jgi:histidinol-phosphate phosphatase family protein
LDRDGTLITERGYLLKARDMRFYPGVSAALRRLTSKGFKLVVVTNQSAVGRGWLTLRGLRAIHTYFLSQLRRRGVRVSGVYACPHAPEAGCRCRKPRPLLARRAARDLNLDLKRSFVVGDQVRDMELGRALKIPGVLVLTGAGRENRKKSQGRAAHVAKNLSGAAAWILRTAEKERSS